MNNNSITEIDRDYNELKMILRGISHEMGNALTVMGYSLKSLGKNESVRENEDWNYLNEDYDYICSLFRDLSEYNNGMEMCETIVEINKILEQIVEKTKEVYLNDGVKICFIAEKKYLVKGDRIKLNQVFINIIKNAYEAILYKNEEGKIEIGIEDDKEYCYVKISDNGCGISKDSLGKIFKPMYTNNKSNGTGLGLPVCKKIIESHGGNILVNSKEGQGSEFIVSFKKA